MGLDRLRNLAQDLRNGKSIPPMTVRGLLRLCDAERRGYWIVKQIRQALNDAKLQTDPDFESAYIDSEITFSLVQEQTSEESTPSLAIEVVDSTVVGDSATVAISLTGHADPTYRISKLEAANKKPVSVSPDATLQEAVTAMLSNDFSQLPVMTSERDVKGVVSWTSIGTRLSLGKHGTYVCELMDIHQEIRGDASLFQAIPIIVQHQYVLIRGNDHRMTGIVTASDLNLQFLQLAEPFLLLGEIENHIRRILGNKFSTQELASVRDPVDSDREVAGVADLTFGEYIRLLEKPEHWEKVDLPIDRKTFIKQLDLVRIIRNDVMHFDPDGIPTEDLERLRDFVQFLQRLQGIGVT